MREFTFAMVSSLSPTFYGCVGSTQDALILFEACLTGTLNHLARRPYDRERPNLIKSGNIFIYEEHSSGIKRWTDGIPWSPSRIMGNFLVYRELQQPFPIGEKKRALKRTKPAAIGKRNEYTMPRNRIINSYGAAASSLDVSSSNVLSKERERSLIGSLVDSYGFKEGGLVKKTISVTIGDVSHHLVSYYTIADMMNNNFTTPSTDPKLRLIIPRLDLSTKQNFSSQIDHEEVDSMQDMDACSLCTTQTYDRNGSETTIQDIPHRLEPEQRLAMPSCSSAYSVYGVNYGTADAVAMNFSSNAYLSQYAQDTNMYSAPADNNYGMQPLRYNSVINTAANATGLQIPQASPNLVQQPSSLEHGNAIDSGYSFQGSYGHHRGTVDVYETYST